MKAHSEIHFENEQKFDPIVRGLATVQIFSSAAKRQIVRRSTGP